MNQKINTRKENKMGTMPVKKLLITMSLPMVLSMLIQALYNIIDSIFVARVSEDALTAVSMVFPIQNLMIAVGVGTGVGINALLSKSLGAKDFDKASSTARNGLFLSLLSYVAFLIFGLTFSRQFFMMQTDNPAIIEYGTSYMMICTTISFGIFFQMTFERLLMSTGNTFYNMITQGIGAVINIILDPILIFGLFGLPRMEIAGAALATVIGQICGMLLGLYFNIKKNREIRINMKGFRPDGQIIRKIYSVGVPTILMQSIGSVMVFGMNRILMGFTSTAVSVFGVYFKLQSFIFMPVFGLSNGMIPIIAYNYGARNKERISAAVRFSIVLAIGIMAIGFACFQILPAQLLSMFNASDAMISIGVPALRSISFCFVFAGFSIIAVSTFQALGNGIYSLIISICRQLVILLPSAYVLANIFGLNQVWLSFPLAEIFALILSIMLLRKITRDKIHTLP